MNPNPSILGLGVNTDTFPSIQSFAQSDVKNAFANAVQHRRLPDIQTLQQHDALPQLALSAAHQALSMAGLISPTHAKLSPDVGEQTALIVVSAWGAIDATVAYLDSMLDADGRYASPRHFSRSVYSSVASIIAIHFGIHGPCETLSFPDNPIAATLHRARRLFAAARCRQVLLIWADQTAEIASDLTRRASTQLQRHEFDRYARSSVGYGAVALLLSQPKIGIAPLSIEMNDSPSTNDRNPFPLDAALTLFKKMIHQSP